MLCRINATIGATDVKAQTINLLRSIQAVCTAAAGSTPSVQPLSGPSTFGTGNCIVEVISNAEAGGWTSSSSTTVTTSYSATNASPYYLDLYNSSGKTTYPYHKVTFSTNIGYNFSSASYANYPLVDMFIGFHTATTMDGNYFSGFSAYGAVADNYSSWTGRSITAGGPPNNPTAAIADTSRGLRSATGEFLVASTANYIIIISANGINYFGVRSNAAWENSYTNNPYVAGFSYNCYSTFSATQATHTGVSTSNQLAVFGYGVDSTGTVSPASPRWRHGWYNNVQGTAAYYNACPISGGAGSINNGYPSWGFGTYSGYAGPIMPFGLRSGNGNTMVGPSTDTATGANVPPAYPVVANYSGSTQNWQIANISALTGMVLPGIYRSLAGSDAFMNQYYTAGTTYVVGTENYYPYTVGNNTGFKDLMLIRKY